MGIPTRFAVYLIALQSFKATENVLNRAAHNVMNTRFSVCGGRAFVEHKTFSAIAAANAFLKALILLPKLKDFLIDLSEV